MSCTNTPFFDNTSSDYIAVRCNLTPASVAGTVVNSVSANILAGPMSGGGTHGITCSDFSTIDNGNGNAIQGPPSQQGCLNTISNGYQNIICGQANFIGTGAFNEINSNVGQCGNFIGSGVRNQIVNSFDSFVGSGRASCIVNGGFSNIGGGDCNCVEGCWNSISGGQCNSTTGCYSFVGGGLFNCIDVAGASPVGTNAIGVGNNNKIVGHSAFSSIDSGGANVICSGYASMIGSGDHNCMCPHPSSAAGIVARSFIGGGNGNYICNDLSVIGGGFGNRVNSIVSVVAGGLDNCIMPTPATASCQVGRNGVLTGLNNVITGQTLFSSIESGGQNIVCNTCTSMIGSGDFNCIVPGFGFPGDIICRSVIAGGSLNCNHANQASIGGGVQNRIYRGANNSFIGGGYFNSTVDRSSFIGGGEQNYISTSGAITGLNTISGGFFNTIGIQSTASNIVGGCDNFITNSESSTIAGGNANRIQAFGAMPNILASFIGSGECNCSHSSFAVMGSGFCNTICGGSDFGLVGSGCCNVAQGPYSFIGSGSVNCAYVSSAIINGDHNIACGEHSFVGNGGCFGLPAFGNHAEVNYSFIGNGVNNRILFVPPNFVQGQCNNFIGNGIDNTIRANIASFIGGGIGNFIDLGGWIAGNAFRSNFIGGGEFNTIALQNTSSFIGAGQSNTIEDNSIANFIGGGTNNRICNLSNNNVVGGGQGNFIEDLTDGNVIAGGCENRIFQNRHCSFIGVGHNSCVDADLSAIVAGNRNETRGAFGFTGNGDRSCIEVNAGFAAIGNGRENCIGNPAGVIASDFNMIGNGLRNWIDGSTVAAGNASDFNFIGNGRDGMIGAGANFSAIISGSQNRNCGTFSFVGTGDQSCIEYTASQSVIGGGLLNTIGNATPASCSTSFNFIGTGNANMIDVGTAAGSESCYNFIGNGRSNNIRPGVCYSSILGGDSNTLSGSYSTIAGGSGNNDSGNPFTGIYGNGIITSPVPGPSSFWVDELVTPNIPIGTCIGGVLAPPGAYPPGSLWYYPDASGNKQVYVV